MDEDSWSLPDSDYEKDPAKEDVVDYDDDSADDSSETTQQSCPMMTQSSFLVPKIDLGAQNKSPSCQDTLGAQVMYGLIHSQEIPSQNDQELFVLDKTLTTKSSLNPMAQEFKPSFGGNFSQNSFAAMASKPAEMSTQTVQRSAPLSADDKLLLNIAQILKTNKLLILMRGCPGSGKSTLANKIMKSLASDKIGAILSTDTFFGPTGSQYQYDVFKLSEAHAWNRDLTLIAINENRDLIIIDNTNIAKWEMSPYAKMANENGYKVKLVEPNTKWKFNAKRLAKCNVHSVCLNKIKHMLGNYEKNVTVEQLLNFKDLKETKSSTEYEWNNSTPMKVQPKRNNTCRDRNNNSNSSSYSSYSPTEVIQKPRETIQDNVCDMDELFSRLPTNFEACSNRDSWGSDDWYEPQDQRQPKKNAIFNHMKSNSSDDGSSSSSDAFEAQVLEIQQLLNKESKIESLSILALTCIHSFNADEIFERASLAAVKGCQMKDKILHECFVKNHARKFLLPNFTDSSNEESSACSIDFQTESLKSSTSEDSIDISSEENSNFYLLLSLQPEFMSLLTHVLGPIHNLNTEEKSPGKTVDIKLDYNAMKSLHKTLTQICAPNKETNVQKPKKESHTKANQWVESSAPTTFSRRISPVVPLSEIMKEQETSTIELKHKLQNNDQATSQKLHKLSLEFPGTDPSVIEKIFEENDYHMHRTLAVLKGQPQETNIDWRCASNSLPTPIRNNNSSTKTRSKIYNWLKVSEDNEQEQFEFYEKLLKDNIKQKNVYSNGPFPAAASYFAQQVSELNQKMKKAKLNALKQEAASKLNHTNYNTIDLHGLNKSEAHFLVNECLSDYLEALKNSTSMKKNLIFITGKGMNSKNKKPVLKPYIVSILKNLHYTCTQDDGLVKVLL